MVGIARRGVVVIGLGAAAAQQRAVSQPQGVAAVGNGLGQPGQTGRGGRQQRGLAAQGLQRPARAAGQAGRIGGVAQHHRVDLGQAVVF